jgi:hypothetical protein
MKLLRDNRPAGERPDGSLGVGSRPSDPEDAASQLQGEIRIAVLGLMESVVRGARRRTTVRTASPCTGRSPV